jgi:signal transduction histidine kinase/DNA-binding response OmpR family regulator/uncharacterized protein (DUF433 family)
VIHERITTDPTIADGAPVIQGAGVPVHQVLDRAAAGRTPEEIVAELPGLELADVQAALEYAVLVVRRPSAFAIAGAREAQAPQVLHEARSDGGQAGLDLKKILIVDDLELNRLYMRTMFKGSGFALSLASNGEEALAKARAELPFLILSDIQMPQVDGFELCRRLKADERTKNAAVIFITAHYRSSKKVSEGLDLGADDFIFRPFERRELLSRVQAVARLKWAEEETRRQARTVTRRNKELELLNELALAVASSLDLDEIFASSMQKLSQLLDAEAVSLLLLDEETQELVVNVSSRRGERASVSVDFRPRGGITDWVIQERVPSIVADVLDDPATGLKIELSSISCLPMSSKEQVIGAVAIINKRGESFSAADWVLLNSAVGIVAVSVENARLLQSVQQQVADLILLNEIGQALTSTLDLGQILSRTTQQVQESLRAGAASLWLLDEESQELVLTASSGPGAQLVTGFRMSVNTGIAGYVARTGEPYFSADVHDDEKFSGLLAEVSDYMPGSMLCVPVQVKDRIIGVVQALHENTRWFDQNDLRLLYSVASSVGIAVENARLFGEVQEFNRHLERMVAERTRELAEEKEKTEAILASMADGLLVLDARNCILTANMVAEGMLDFRLSEAQGRPIGSERLASPLWRCVSDMASGDELTVGASHFGEPADPAGGTGSRVVDVPDPTRLNGVLSIQAHAARVRDEAGQIIGTVIVLRDITAVKEVERMKARFMAGVTHELKTPLSVIRLHANNLQTYHTRLPERKRDELLSAIQNQVKLLERLVEGILELSRLDAGEAIGERQPVNLATVTDQVVADLRPLAEAGQVELHWMKPTASVTTLADADQMERMIRNLVDNAIKYTPTGGSVEVQLTSQGADSLEIRIADTGIGIPLEHQSRVFGRFYRVDPSHTTPGAGLGLSIVKEIVNVHGGDVRLESGPGTGSTFIVTLPGSVANPRPEPSA